MSTRLRSTSLASAGALLLVLTFAGLAAGRVVLTDAPATEVTAPDTTASFEDTNGNGIDDDCEESVVADPTAAAAAEAAVDVNHDGVISVSEAAHSGRIGGKNCNHGGYVSWVAHGAPDGTTESSEADSDGATTDHAAAKAAKEAAKAAKQAAKTVAKVAKEAAKAERHAARDAAKANKEHGKGKSKSKLH